MQTADSTNFARGYQRAGSEEADPGPTRTRSGHDPDVTSGSGADFVHGARRYRLNRHGVLWYHRMFRALLDRALFFLAFGDWAAAGWRQNQQPLTTAARLQSRSVGSGAEPVLGSGRLFSAGNVTHAFRSSLITSDFPTHRDCEL